ncbi:MAG: short chain dehydrogenase, partial [Dermabacter sp.]|nr:short chain dehydrogenase [Dermabacter sp.]
FAEEIAKLATADLPTGHIELVGGAQDFLAQVDAK